MTEHFTREEAVVLAGGLGMYSIDHADLCELLNAAVTAKVKEWGAQGAVGEIVSDNGRRSTKWFEPVPLGTKLYTRAQAAQPAEVQWATLQGKGHPDTMPAEPVSAELVEAFKAARETLQRANDQQGYSPICDTIWHTPYETLFDFMDAAISRAQAAPVVGVPDGWIPVGARMPDSGQTVLALQTWDHSGKQSIIRASWVMAKTVESGDDSEIGEYDEATDTYYDPEGWYERISHWGEFAAVAVTGAKVTHWASLKPMLASAQPQQKEG